MKHHLLLLLLCFLGISNILKAEKVERVIFNYSLDNFEIRYENDVVSVVGWLINADHIPCSPALPTLFYSVSVPNGMRYAGYRVTVPDTVVICTNKLLERNSDPIPYGEKNKYIGSVKTWGKKKEVCDDLKGIFPPEKIICDADGYILYPFEYNSDTKELFFTPTVIVDRILVSEDDLRDVSQIQSSEDTDEIISISIYNGAKEVELQE